MTGKALGKIIKAEYGFDKDYPFVKGLFVQLETEFGVCGRYVENVFDYLEDAKVNYVSQLRNKPVEATFDRNMLVSFRILKEVL